MTLINDSGAKRNQLIRNREEQQHHLLSNLADVIDPTYGHLAKNNMVHRVGSHGS